MYQMLFKSRWIALAFAGLTVLSVLTFVGEEGRESTLTRLTRDLRSQQGLADASPKDVAIARSEASAARIIEAEPPVIEDFVPDEELVDDAAGMDPTPDQPDNSDEGGPAEESPPDGDVIIIHHTEPETSPAE